MLRYILDITKCLYTSQQSSMPVFQHRLISSSTKLICFVLICVLTYLEIYGLELASSTRITTNMKFCNYLSLQDWDVRFKESTNDITYDLWGYQKICAIPAEEYNQKWRIVTLSLKAILGRPQHLKQAAEIFVHWTTF